MKLKVDHDIAMMASLPKNSFLRKKRKKRKKGRNGESSFAAASEE